MALNPETLPGELTALDMGLATGNGNQTGIDIRDFIGKILVVVNLDSGVVTLQESDELATGYAAFDPAKTTDADGVTKIEVDTRSTKRYIRAVTSGTPDAASIVAIGKKQETA